MHKQVELDNYKSATSNRQSVEKQIQEEIQNHRYQIVQSKPQIVSALGAIPKRDSNKIRIIHDCSRPTGHSLNEFAYHNPFKYQSIQDAVDIISPNYYLAKLDLSNAYRSVRIHPSNFAATGLKWQFLGDKHNTYMVDTCLPFGAKASPGIFNELSQAVRRIMQAKGFPGLIVYLDDFLVIAPTKEECNIALMTLLSLVRKLGFAINYNKLVMPCQRLTFLGIVLDTIKMTLELPKAKLLELYNDLHQFNMKKKVTKYALQSLVGKLNWATQCIQGGRFYLRRLIDTISKLKAPWHHSRVTSEIRADLRWWLDFMCIFNGAMPMVDNRPTTPVFIDSCEIGAGAFYKGDIAYMPWTAWPAATNLHINFKETLTLEMAAVKWAPLWTNRKVYIYCDNQCAVGIINKGSTKNPIVMSSLRRLFWLSACYNFKLQAIYYPGKNNILADAISRVHQPNGYSRLCTILNNYY